MDRITRILARRAELGIDALLVMTPANTHYLSGFRAIVYSRPIAVLAHERPALVIPELELQHAQAHSGIADMRWYADTAFGAAGGKLPLDVALELVAEAVRERGITRLGFEAAGMTYQGYQALQKQLDVALVPCQGVVEQARMVKDTQEVELIRAGCRLAALGMATEIRLSKPGASELEIMARGNLAMLMEGLRRYPEYPIEAGSRPIAGVPKTFLPHSLCDGNQVQARDVIIHGTGATVNGYFSEDERTIFVGEPSIEQRRLFEIMYAAQQSALHAIRPGVPCKAIDAAARSVIENAGYGENFTHRTGHGIGLQEHELPFFAAGDKTILQPGMVLSVEPGIYVEGMGGFRHSDTIVVTEQGVDILTDSPRERGELTV